MLFFALSIFIFAFGLTLVYETIRLVLTGRAPNVLSLARRLTLTMYAYSVVFAFEGAKQGGIALAVCTGACFVALTALTFRRRRTAC